jgi:hypothetical protein
MLQLARQALASPDRPIACVLMLVVPLAGAQTIADYSRAQRAWLESAMSQAAARSAGLAASAPLLAAPAVPAASAPARRIAMPAPAPAVQISGVFASGSVSVAEVMVNATSYLLGVGQGVPGTAWRVETIAIDKVVLGPLGGMAPTDAAGARRVFSLPALY